ncbi:hypothetical protein SAMN04488066_11037 [Halorubrum aquaticum]|uniref:Uncharacterized protein n=1 Tax=Halorubrum aquaticum TaxID=387340 RepID=A0A1I3B7E7_9EURY|nr:hypothetical protein [Halorubrum aquaticum]SFH58152.1 hypothetical protein SAMN04488066_11037 [Halorubrum aquaticum]
MSPSLRTVLIGSNERGPLRRLLPAALCFLGVFVGYAVGVFEIPGGVVFLPWDAAVAGVLVAAALAHRGDGLAVAWVVVYASLLGYSADHYLLGLPGRPLLERVAALLGVDGLVYLGVQALVLGTLAWIGGTVAARVAATVRDRRSTTDRG